VTGELSKGTFLGSLSGLVGGDVANNVSSHRHGPTR